MKHTRTLLSFALSISGPILMAVPAWAAPAMPPGTISSEVHIKVTVPDVHYIVVDDAGSIITVTSNTTVDTTPRVYANQIKQGLERPLTPELATLYDKIVPAGSSQPGILYERGSPEALKMVGELSER